MSAGIRARSKRCYRFWEPHLDLSRQFINSALGQAVDPVTIMGAGMLLDVDTSFLDRSSGKLTLVDIDPTLKNHWKRCFPSKLARAQLEMRVADITGCMDAWFKDLRYAIKNKSSIEDIVILLNSFEPYVIAERGAYPGIVVSINLLGQLGVYWRDRAVSLLKSNSYYFQSPDLPVPQIVEAIEASVAKLELAHLVLLSGFSQIILLTDIYYHYYKKDMADWQTESALSFSSERLTYFLEGRAFMVENKSSWLWHIAPQDVENPEYGEIHEVNAFHFKRI